MENDLENLFQKLTDQLPTKIDERDDNNNLIFSANNLPIAPPHLKTPNLIINKNWHDYNTGYDQNLSGLYRADGIRFQASKRTYRQLALLILAVLFQPEPAQVHLELTHPASTIKHLVISYEYTKLEEIWAYATRPFGFQYIPKETGRHPWYYDRDKPDPYDLPIFQLGNWQQLTFSEEDYQNRDTVIGFGNDRATVRLAELLLNAGLPQNGVVEYKLEDEGGFRGVGIHSAEVAFYLPGSLGWSRLLAE